MTVELADRLQKLRKAHGYTQDSLADALGVSRQAVSKWECTEASPDTDNLIALARLYGITLDELVNGNEEKAEEKTAEPDKEAESASSGESGEQAGTADGKDKSSKVHISIGRGRINITGGHIGDDDDYDEDFDEDSRGKVDIDLNEIHVEDEDGTTVHIDGDGIRVKDGGKTVFTGNNMNADENGVHISSDDGTEVHLDGDHIYVNGKDLGQKHFKRGKIVGISACVTVMLCVTAYILLGALGGWWHPAWIVFLAIPVVPSLVDAILKRRADEFAYPVLVAAVYLVLGCIFGWWHPGWVVFLTIPVYYTVVNSIKKQ